MVKDYAAELGQVRKREDRPITAGEDQMLIDPLPAMSQNIVCGLCGGNVTTTEIDMHQIELPYCPTCSIYFIPSWSIIGGKFVVRFNFKTPHDEFIVVNTIRQTPPVQQEPASTDNSAPVQTAPISDANTPTRKHPTVREQILTILEQKGIVEFGYLRTHIDAGKQSIHKELKALVRQRIVEKPKYGQYKLGKNRTHTP